MHHARAHHARALAAHEYRRDVSIVNNSGSKLKIRHTSALGNLVLFSSAGRASGESTYARRKIENNNDTNFSVFKKKYMRRARAKASEMCQL